MPSSTVENYIKQLYMEQDAHPRRFVPMGRMAEIMGVVPGTVTTMVKALHESGLVDYEARKGVRLTAGGRKLALHVLRRHRLIELFLVEHLGLGWSEVHEEAEMLEHVISDRVLDAIDRALGLPRFDPHGDPIPDKHGAVEERALVALSQAEPGKSYRVAQVSDRDAAFLRLVEERELRPGTEIAIIENDPLTAAVSLRRTGSRGIITLGHAAAEKIFVLVMS